MKLSDLTQQAGEWLRGSGPMSDIVISSRIRLARNVAGYPFLTKASPQDRQALEKRVRDVVLGSAISPQMLYVDLESAPQHVLRRGHAVMPLDGEPVSGVEVSKRDLFCHLAVRPVNPRARRRTHDRHWRVPLSQGRVRCHRVSR